MEKSVQITLIVAVAVVILAVIGVASFSNFMPTNTVSVSGQATVKAVPDLVGVYFEIKTTGDSATEARDEASKIYDILLVNLVKEGISSDEIFTQNFNVYPQYDWNKNQREIIGYEVNHNIKVELPADSENIGKVIDAGVNSGAFINAINFELEKEHEKDLKSEAIELATEDARVKAEAIADGLGKRLGGIYSVSESSFNYRPWVLYETANAEADIAQAKEAVTTIQPSEQDVYAHISVVYKIR